MRLEESQRRRWAQCWVSSGVFQDFLESTVPTCEGNSDAPGRGWQVCLHPGDQVGGAPSAGVSQQLCAFSLRALGLG